MKEQKKQEKILKELSKKLDMETKKAERDGAKVKELEAEVAALTKDRGMFSIISVYLLFRLVLQRTVGAALFLESTHAIY